MAQVTFGTVLQEARERKGMDLSTAARRLRIRPDILRSIEEDDFARMPPRGYTRNMVNAYARLLGLNPTEITRMYLDEAYAYQVGRARSDVRPSGFDMGGTSRTKRSGAARPVPPEEPEERVPRQNAFGRTLYDDRTAYTRSDYGRSAAPAAGGRVYSEGRTHTSRHSALPNGQYTNFYAGPKAPSGVQSKLPFLIAGAVILVVLVIVLVFAFGGKGGGEEDLPTVPVTGIDDTTQGEGDEGSQEPVAPPAPVAPTSAKVVYEVASGESVYMDIYEDGNITSGGTVDGPAKKEFDVTGTFKLVTSNPGGVTVTVDGTKLEPTGDESTGIYSFSVDFPAILEQWKADHPTAGTAGTAGTTGTGSSGSGTTDGASTPAA